MNVIRFRNMVTGVALVGAILHAGGFARAATISWNGTGSAWLDTARWTGGVVPGSAGTTTNDDVAVFAVAPQLTAGINMNTAAGNYYLGTLVKSSTGNRIVNNSSTTVPGVLTLNGFTLNTVALGANTPNVIIHMNGASGTFSINNGTGTGTLGLNLPAAVNYNVVIDGSGGTGGNVILNSSVSGLGGITISRASPLTSQVQLLGNNSYNGDTVVNAARFRAGGGNGIPNGIGKGNLVLSGTVTVGPPVQPLFGIIANETINGLSGNGFVDNDGSTPLTLTVGDGDATTTFAGTVWNSGAAVQLAFLHLTKIGDGTLTLSGANSYSGKTNINDGTLLVNGTHFGTHLGLLNVTDAYSVASGATLGGTGQIGGAVTVAAGGFLAPGASIESLQVASASIAGTLQIEIDESDAFVNDLLNVVGALDISAATLDFDISGGLTQTAYVIAKYGSGGLTGTFASSNTPVGYRIAYNYQHGNQIALTVVPEPASAWLLALGIVGVAWIRRR